MGKRNQKLNERGKKARTSPEVAEKLPNSHSDSPGHPLSWWWFCAIVILVAGIHLSHRGVFKKDFTGLDDFVYIYPLQQLSLSQYIPQWLLKPGALAFPVRDASFGLDIMLSSWLGFQTATITSVLVFVVYLAVLFHLFRLLLPPLGTLLLLILVGLHPIEVETIQWSISRKHLLVGLWISLGATVCLRMARIARGEIASRASAAHPTKSKDGGAGAVPGNRSSRFVGEWALLVLCYLLSTLSHPTGIFFPLWVVVFLWNIKGVQRVGVIAYLCCAGLIGVGWTKFISSINADYGSLADFSFGTLSPRVLLWENGVLGLGRVGWQLLVPVSQSVHFQPEDHRNLIGFCLVIAVCILLARAELINQKTAPAQSKSPRPMRSAGGMTLSALVILLICTSLPQLLFCIRRDDFAIADRLLFLPFPYLIATICYLPSVCSLLLKGSAILNFPGFVGESTESNSAHRQVILRSGISAGIVVLVVFYSVVSYRATFLWDTTNKAVDHCAESADASRCWGYKLIEWREQGCNRLMQSSEQLLPRLSLEARASHRIGPFLVDGFDAIATCQASLTTVPVSLRMAAIRRFREQGAPPTSTAFAEMITNLTAGNLRAAHEVVKERFVNTLPSNQDVTPTSLGRIVGAVQVLCLRPEMRADGCGDTFQQLRIRYGGNDIKDHIVEAARSLSLAALQVAKIEVTMPASTGGGS